MFCVATAHAQPSLRAVAERRASPSLPGGNGFYVEPLTPDGGMYLPTGLAVAPTGTIYAIQKQGDVRVVRPGGELLEAPLVSVWGEVFADGDRGLTGIALHPDFPATPYIYLFYSVDDIPLPQPDTRFRGYSRLTRYTVDASGESVVPGSRTVLLGESPEDGVISCYNSHSSGTLQFGHDGALYVSHGDAASWAMYDTGGLYPECFDGTGIDPAKDLGAYRAQTTASMAGKILRLDPQTGGGLPDNPFWTGDPYDEASRVWALGLRNPFRFAVSPQDPFNPERTELYVGDVGDGRYEEIDRVEGGENFGWPCFEGPSFHPDFAALPPPPGVSCSGPFEGTLTTPYAYFHHSLPEASAPAGRIAASITGGTFYLGTSYPERFHGMLVFADYSKGWIAAARVGEVGLEATEELVTEAGFIADLAYDPTMDAIVAVDVVRGSLVVLRHAGDGPPPPVARGSVSEPFGEVPHAVTFEDAGSADASGGSLTYRWSFGDGQGADGATATHVYGSPGVYAATLTVENAAGQTSQAVVPVSVGLSLPVLEIDPTLEHVVPESGFVELAFTASDSRGETLDAFWELDLVHNVHVHPSFARTDGPQGVLIAEPHAAPGELAFYRARAVAIDEEGLRVTQEHTLRNVVPEEIDLGTAADRYPDGDAQVLYVAHPVEVGRLTLPMGDNGALGLDVVVNGEWVEIDPVYLLPEGDVTQVLFPSISTTAIRVRSAQTSVAGLHARFPIDPDLGAWDPADAGGTAAGRTAPFGDGLTLVGSGTFTEGEYHTARQSLAGDGSVTLHLDYLDGGDEAFAGAAVHTGLAPTDTGLAIGRAGDGRILAWRRVAGQATATQLDAWDASWFRVRRYRGTLIGEVSTDSLVWTEALSVGVSASAPLVAGPVVSGGDGVAVGWFDYAAVQSAGVVRPPSGTFRIFDPFPNPGRGNATLVVNAGVPGTYSVQIVDARGRVVQEAGIARVVVEPETFETTLDREELAPGVYVIRVLNQDTGDARHTRMVVLR